MWQVCKLDTLSRIIKLQRTKVTVVTRRYGVDHKVPEIEVTFSNGRIISISTGKFARFASGTAVCTQDDTTVMVTCVSKGKSGNQSNFVPLTVDYRIKYAAAGRIPRNFLRKEMSPTEREILAARLVDRSVRPMFPSNFLSETQLVCNALAVGASHSADLLAINASSAALSLSSIPWNGPIGAVRLGLCDNEIVVNPTRRELQSSGLDLIVAATRQNLVVMIEGKGDVVLLQDLLKAVKQGTKEAQAIVSGIEKLQKLYGKAKEKVSIPKEISEDIINAIHTMSSTRLREIFRDHTHDKVSRDNAINAVRGTTVDKICSSYPDVEPSAITSFFNKLCKQIFRDLVLEEKRRCDGRMPHDLRDISCQVDLYKPLHGSALFQRGQTQVFCTVSLDSQESALKLDSLTSLDSGVKAKNFFLHYEFPPYATGEIGRIGSAGRREIGHGALAEKGLLPTLPKNFPFTVRLTTEVLESNGSSSMASVCGGSLALMDSGVPVLAPAAGVAMGLIAKYPNDDTKHLEDYVILTDILGIEDYMGDMDMKVAGTKKGVTALQVDLKIPGVPLKVIMEALQKATDAKVKIVDIMNQCIADPRSNLKDCWPLRQNFQIEAHQRAKLMGPGGINIKRLYLEVGAQLTQLDDTTFELFAPSKVAMDEAKEQIDRLLQDKNVPVLEFGGIYAAQIVELKEIGVMVTLYPNMQPTLLHNSQLDRRKVAHPSVLGLEVGQEIQVKYFGRDPVSGFMRLSRKVLQVSTPSITRNVTEA